jgi:hypothetical protein
MYWLPALITPERAWLLPLSPRAARTLTQVLLTGSPAISIEAFLFDPAFTLWCLAHMGPQHDATELTIRDLLRWSLAQPWARIFGAGAAAITQVPSVRPTYRVCHDLAMRSVVQAVSVAGRESQVECDGRGLLSLVANGRLWFAAAQGQSDRWPPSCFPASFRAALDAEAVRDLPNARLSERFQQQVRQTWLGDDRWPAVFTRLCSRMQRSARLENAFHQELHRQKMLAMKELAYGASHEINNPLANIATHAQNLLREEHDEDKRRQLAAINRQAFRAHEMLADMMLFAKPPRLEKGPVDLVELLRTVQSYLHQAAHAKGIALVCTSSSPPLQIDADQTQLAAALQAIGQNAIDALKTRGRIELFGRRDRDGSVEIVVQDDGPGIPDSIRAHLFDPFFSGREAGRGLGFGLPKAWRIVTEHGGEIRVESEQGKATRFCISLPQPTPSPSGAQRSGMT